jgi:hypothetical protein
LVALLESHNHRVGLIRVGFDGLVLANTLEREELANCLFVLND